MFRIGTLTATIALALPTAASAFNFGFVRAPDSMDPIFVLLAIAMAPLFVLLLLAKPRDVPFNQLYANVGRLNWAAKLLYFAFTAVFVVFMILLFVGMGLQRASESGL